MPHRGVLECVVLWQGDVMVADFTLVNCHLLLIPHDVVQIRKVVVHVDTVAIATLSPTRQLRTL